MGKNLNAMSKEAANFIQNYFEKERFDIGLIAGTGLSEFTQALNGKEIKYDKIPNFPILPEQHNCGSMIHATIADKEVLYLNERLHYYQGYPIKMVGFPVRIMKHLGINSLIMINSAATLSETMNPGDIMMIKDHINMMGVNPLAGIVNNHKNKFINMTNAYSKRLRDLLKSTTTLNLKEGVYVGVTGPNFETPAEANIMRLIGGDVIGMSTIPETLVARQCDIEVIAISCISNYSAAIKNPRLSQNDSILLAEKAEENAVTAILNLIALM